MEDRLDAFEFGRQLLVTNDLDPVYIVLHEANLGNHILCRWLLAYWCFYHAGTASWITDHGCYWDAMLTAAGSKTYPRCHERRHFRGGLALKSVRWLEERGVNELFAPLLHADLKLETVMKTVGGWYGFGPWIAFKIADMLERLRLAQVAFDAGGVFLFDSPQKGAEKLREELRADVPDVELGTWASNIILARLDGSLAPPTYDRTVNVQEAETILCKWKSHMGGHYTVGEDVKALRAGLLRFAKVKTSQRLLAGGKAGGLW